MITDWNLLADRGVGGRHRIGPMDGLPCLSLWRPWEEPVGVGHKPVENRTWPPAPWLIGQPIAIHAAKRYDASCIPFLAQRGFAVGPRTTSNNDRAGRVVAVATVLGFLDARDTDTPHDRFENRCWQRTRDEPEVMMRRAYLGGDRWEIAASATVNAFDRVLKLEEDPYFMGPVGWLLGEAIELPAAARPLVLGHQGLFRLSYSQSQAVCRAAASVQAAALRRVIGLDQERA